jgi:hypothetical protein
MEIIVFAANFDELIPQINEFCKSYFDEFIKNKELYARQDAYNLKIEAARLVCIHLAREAQRQKDIKLVQFYSTKQKEFLYEREKIATEKKW